MSLVPEGKLKNDLSMPLETPPRPRLVYKLSTLISISTEQFGLIYKPGRPVLTLFPKSLVFSYAVCDLASEARARERPRGLSACLKIVWRFVFIRV